MSYQALHNRCKRIDDLGHALAILHWDEAAMMPSGAGDVRAQALATLGGEIHDLTAADETGELIAAAQNEDLDPWQTANVELAHRAWRKARAVPTDLQMAASRAASACEQGWREARGRNDWAAVAGKLATVLDLTRQKAEALAAALQCEPYDALLDEYEEGLRRQDIDPLFEELRSALPPLVDHALGRQTPPDPLPGPFSQERQQALAQELMRTIGFDFQRGLLGVSHHPFCGGVPDDTRITTRYNESDFLESMFAVLHETGHALYQQGLPKAWRGQPVGEAGGMALHESQSLTMEMQLCRGRAFLEFAAPLIQRQLLGAETAAAQWQPDNLARHAAKVERSYIRVDADELTYPLHVVLRYELETQLLAGGLKVADIPDAWDAAMQDTLGLSTAGDFANGCMQDVHWFGGLIGYFPTYTLGAVIAAQLYQAAQQQMAGLDDAIRGGEFEVLLDWQRRHVHGRGRSLPTLRLVQEASGAELASTAFLGHLRRRYGGAA